MPTIRTPIQKIFLNSTASSVTFSNIPQTFTDLKIVIAARSSRTTANADGAVLRINGDSNSSNYSIRRFYGDGSSAAVSNLFTGLLTTTASCTANTFGNSDGFIPNYTAVGSKTLITASSSESSSSQAYQHFAAIRWSGNAALTSIEIVPEVTGPWVAGSTFYLYGISHVPIIRGGIETVSDGYRYHIFRSSGSLQVIEGGSVECLVVAGGGAGGGGDGGGGGGGGFLNGRRRLSSFTTHTVTVGSGGANSTAGRGSNGGNSTFLDFTSIGGGAGGAPLDYGTGQAGSSGGSGGGNGFGQSTGSNLGSGGTGTAGQGNNGGRYSRLNTPIRGGCGGGGGAGAVGSNGIVGGGYSTSFGGTGGIGKEWPENSGTFYAGGGAGNADGDVQSIGGRGGGAAGGGGTAGMNAQPNTGGGGGGSGYLVNGSNGGSGIVIIRYPYYEN